MKKVIYIHGANASPSSFNYLCQVLPPHIMSFVNYATFDRAVDVIARVAQEIEDLGEKVYLVGHSLGGVISVNISYATTLIEKIVTISSPHGGSEFAQRLRWFHPRYPMLREISPNGDVIAPIAKRGAVVPTMCVVSKAGSTPLFNEANDGVITVDSQLVLNNAEFCELELNHFETLLSTQTADIIEKFIFKEDHEDDGIIK